MQVHGGYVGEGTVTRWHKGVKICTAIYLVSGIKYVKLGNKHIVKYYRK